MQWIHFKSSFKFIIITTSTDILYFVLLQWENAIGTDNSVNPYSMFEL